MNLIEDIKPISYLKTNDADMLKRVNDTHNPIIITQNGEAKAVLLDTESYESMINGLGIMKVLSQSEKEIEENQVADNEKVFSDVKKILTNGKK